MKQNKPLISVVVPVYNVEACLQRCLDSLAAQTYSNLEIIVVDDGSTDKSGSICDAWEARDGRVQAVHFAVNRGPAAARNEGVRRAKGAYAAFVDSDDCVEPDYLERLYENLRENNAQISICGSTGIRGDGGRAAVYSSGEALRCLARGIPFPWTPWGKLFAMEPVKKCPFDEHIYYSEDILFLYEVFRQAHRVSYFPARLYHYATRRDSQVHGGINERKCSALWVNDMICAKVCACFPEAAEDFRQMALEVNRSLAMQAVKGGGSRGEVFGYLKRIQKNTRYHFSFRALALGGSKKHRAAILLLYLNAAAFWAAAFCITARTAGGGRKKPDGEAKKDGERWNKKGR